MNRTMIKIVAIALAIFTICIILSVALGIGIAFSGGAVFGTPAFGEIVSNAVGSGFFLGAIINCALLLANSD